MKKNFKCRKNTSKYRKIEKKWGNIKPSKFTKRNHSHNKYSKKIPLFVLFVCDLSCKSFVCILCNGDERVGPIRTRASDQGPVKFTTILLLLHL